MMENSWRRWVCSVLALQMLCTPLAYALSVGAAEEAAEAEVELAEEYAYKGVTVGFGVPENDPDLMASEQDTPGRRFDLEQVLTPAGMKRSASASIRKDCWINGADGVYLDLEKLCPDIGRLPDKMLTGWYYFEDTDNTAPPTWSYTEDLTDEAESSDGNKLGPDPTPASGAILPNGYLPLVARWEDSNISEGRSAAIYLPGETEKAVLYHDDISGLTKKELEEQTGGIGFDPAIQDYYLRVSSDMETVQLIFDAFEPYGAFADVVDYRHGYDIGSHQVLDTDPVKLEEHGADAPVGLSVAFGEGEKDLSDQLFYAIENDGGYYDGWWFPANSGGDIDGAGPAPAYSTWRADAIPLDPAAGAEGQYNTITLAVTAPNGVSFTEYRFHIQRLTDPVMDLAPGNTPFGMIERDTSSVWGSGPEEVQAAKDGAKDYFSRNHRFDLEQDHPRPMDESNNNGHIYPGAYPTEAWLGDNYDEDPRAIVVYEDTGFVEPGFTLTDSAGNTVSYGDGEELAGSVTRELVLRLADVLTTGSVGKDQGTPWPCQDKKIVLEPDGGSFIDLRGQHVVPGIYQMDYRFTDPLTEKTYGFDETEGFWPENADTCKTGFRRTLIVLPAPGDVDMDGEATFADGAALDAAVSDPVSFLKKAGSDDAAALFTHRVCNVAGPDVPVVDRADALALKDGYAPQLVNSGNKNWSDYYYLPLPDGDTAPDRETLPPMEEAQGRAALSLSYLGKGARPSASAQPPLEADLQLGDVFWVGVRLDPSEQDLLKGDLQALRLSLAYDSRYVEPVGFADTIPVSGEEAWRETLRTFNILQGSANTLWSGTQYAYTLGLDKDDQGVGLGMDRAISAYPSRPITPLENAAGLDRLQEIVVSFRKDVSGRPVSLNQGGCLLAAPFRVKQHPKLGASSWDFVELGLGMRELAATDSLGRTLVYSRTQPVFGGASESLGEAVYLPQGPGLTLGLGKDTTPTTHLTNQAPGAAVGSDAGYGDWFLCHSDSFMTQKLTDGALPPGLVLDSRTGDISGWPTEAGYYVFYIANAPFSIQVDKAPMRLYTVSADKYYGEELYCGVGSGDVVWRYWPEDVKDRVFPEGDRPGLVNTGRSADLPALLGPEGDGAFVPPTFTAVTGEGGAIDRAVPVGTYPFTQAQAPYSTNYDFTCLTEAPDGKATGSLEILRRPVVVDALAPQDGQDISVGTIFDDDSPTLAGCSAVNTDTEGAYHFVPGLPVKLPAYDGAAGTYDGRRLTGPAMLPGDELKVTYTAVYRKEAKDAAPPEGKNFVLDDGVDTEPRTVDLSTLRMDAAYGAAANYDLVSNAFQDTATATGTVHRKVFTSIDIVRVPWQDPDEAGKPVYRTYTYGQNLSMSGASLLIIPKSGDKGELITYKESVYADLGLEVSWATEAQKEAGEKGELTASHGQSLTPKDHDGRYLCISTVTTGADGKPAVTAYSQDPVAVEKKELTLTVVDRGRYYGEPDQGELTYTYDRTMLITRDRPVGVDLSQPGTAEELERQLKDVKGYWFAEPTLIAVESLSMEGWREDPSKLVPITQDTPVSNVANRILITGAETDNYRFTYVRNDGGPNKTTGPDYGYGTLFIYPRPIVVDAVQAPGEPLLAVYADTEDLDIKGYRFSPDDLTLAQPKEADGHLNYYLPGVQGGDPEQRQPKMTLTGSPVYKGELGFKATVSFRGFQDRPYRNSFTEGYFDLKGAAEKEYPVVLRDLALDPSLPDTRNYVLVFHTYGDAYDGYPASRDSQDYRAGMGTVKLRAIESVTFTRFDSTDYTYGDQLSLQDVSAVIHYEGGLDEPLTYTRVSKDMDNFQERGLRFYFWTDESSLDPDAQQIRAKATAAGFYVTVGEEDGAYLAVGGRRHPSHPLVLSNQSSAPISVTKKDLPVQLQDIHRFYGEENGTYQFTFRIADLAQPDRGKVASGGETAPGPALADVDPDGYTAPGFRTEAGPGSTVKALGKEGYELTLDGSGSMTNYRLAPKAGHIYVYRRPIRVDRVVSSYSDDITKDRSIYTIYADTEARLFTTSIGRDRYAANLPGSTAATPETANRVLALTGPALRSGDVVDMSLKVQFSKEITDLETAHMEQDVQVSGFAVLPGGQGGNYYLLSDRPNDNKAKGRIELREIEKIEIVQPPKRALDSYVYGDELELQGLEVKITYAKKDMESSNPTRNVAYAGQAGFNAEGLFLNYWSGPAPTDPNAYGDGLLNRAANSGDHLTIAPDHSLAPEPGDTHWDPSFAHQGKQLIVTARRNKEHGFAVPQVLSGAIALQPRRVGYALEAEDKIYDGTTAGAGTVTLEDIFQGDVVWSVTGSAYEPDRFTDLNTPEGFAAYYAEFYAYIREKGAYSFASAGKGLAFTYLYPNVRYADDIHSAEVPAALSAPYWLTEQAPRDPAGAGWDIFGPVAPMPVEVTGITLTGPDAANYTFAADGAEVRETQVLRTTRDQADDGQDPAPYATILKAQRPALPDLARPGLELDEHTNVLRLLYGQSVADLFGDAAYDPAELHLEYALDRFDPVTGATERHGEGEGWQDTTYFGGEAVAVPAAPDGFVPDGSGSSGDKEEIVKGQVYRWAEADPGLGTRTALARDADYRAVVRLAETHNYLPSEPLASVDDDALAAAAAEAEARSKAWADLFETLEKGGKLPEDFQETILAGPVVKTYAQRLDLLSATPGKDGAGEKAEALTLEAVWFTDVQTYAHDKVMDAVARNTEPQRYYAYYWDAGKKTQVKFDPDGLDLTGPFTVEVEAEGGKVEVLVNEDGIARLYVATSPTSSGISGSITIKPGSLEARVGDEPVTLTAVVRGDWGGTLRWSSSDTGVATVSPDGVVTFVGPGTAKITAKLGPLTDSIQVKVGEALPAVQAEEEETVGFFQANFTGPFLFLNAALHFRPQLGITRGELVELLDQFFAPKEAAGEVVTFEDVERGAAFAEALDRMSAYGIVTGVPGGKFRPGDFATRAELAAMLARMMDLPIPDTRKKPHAFVDAGEGDTWAWAYIDALDLAGVANGTGEGRFEPERVLTRAEFAAFLTRALKGGMDPEAAGLVIPADVPGDHWGYEAILRAVNGLPEAAGPEG